MRFGVVGCGVIGQRRTQFLPTGCKVTAVYDPSGDRARALASPHGATVHSSLQALIASQQVDAVIVATTNDASVPATQACINAGHHVLVEKPTARSAQELATLRVPSNVVVKVGFNHRFHPAFTEIMKLQDPTDPVMFVVARYGNGARVGFDSEWRADVSRAGGGELLDQGVHLIDLASVILPGLDVKTAWVRTHYWSMPVDDNAWGILGTAKGQTFSFHVSSSEWKNEFRFEVYSRRRKWVWAGLGRSYGPETLTIYSMKPEMGPPDTLVIDFPAEDSSWQLENENFVAAVTRGVKVFGGLDDAQHALTMVDRIYRRSAALQHDTPHPLWFTS